MDYMEGLVWSKINHLAVQSNSIPVSAADPLLQVADIIKQNN